MGQDDKVGQGEDPGIASREGVYERLQAEDLANETRIFWSEVAVAALIGFAAIAYFIFV
jgi:hypothetical protein